MALPGLGVSQELEAQHSLSCISAASEKIFFKQQRCRGGLVSANCVPWEVLGCLLLPLNGKPRHLTPPLTFPQILLSK